VHSAPKIADSFSVNDSDLKDASLLARGQVVQHQIFDLARVERMQVKDTINW